MKKDEISLSTKQKIADALKSLMAKKPFDKITVRELLEAADVTRPTFYYHFEDIYDLMVWMFNTELLSLMEKSENCVTWDDGILLTLRYVEQNRAVCLCAYNSIGREELERFFRKSTERIVQNFVNELLTEVPAKSEHAQYIAEFYTDALVSALAHWLKEPKGRSPEQMVELLDITLHGNIRAALERSATEK